MTQFLFIGAPEMFVILVIVIMLFGADKIPEIARGLGKGIRQVKDATNEIKREINDSVKEQGLDTDFVKDIKNDIQNEVESLQSDFEDLRGPIRRKR